MFDVMADWLTVPLLHQEAGKAPRRIGLSHLSIAPYGVFATKDGKDILISIQSDREWAKFSTEFLGKPGVATDERFATNVARVKNRAATDARSAAFCRTLTNRQSRAPSDSGRRRIRTVNDMAGLSTFPFAPDHGRDFCRLNFVSGAGSTFVGSSEDTGES
jgi:formyl-CoA transferase